MSYSTRLNGIDCTKMPISAIEAHTVNSFCNQLSLFLIVNNYYNVL